MENVNIKGIVIAIAITLLLDTVGGIAGIPLFTEAMTEEAILTIEKRPSFLLYALVVGLLTTFIGGYICAKFGELAPYKNAVIFGVISAVIGLMLATFDPLWFDLLAFITVIPAATLGGHIVAHKMHNE